MLELGLTFDFGQMIIDNEIAAMNRRYNYRVDSLWTPVARYLAALPEKYDESLAYDRYLDARRTQVDMLTRLVTAVRALLTPEQRRKLPPQVVNTLDPRYLALIRSGNGTYVGAAGPSMMFFGGGMEFAAMAAMESVVIMHR